MKIYIVHHDLIDETGKAFQDISNEELIALCEKDEENDLHDVFDSIEELSANWNTEEIFYPSSSYMRVIDDEPEVQPAPEPAKPKRTPKSMCAVMDFIRKNWKEKYGDEFCVDVPERCVTYLVKGDDPGSIKKVLDGVRERIYERYPKSVRTMSVLPLWKDYGKTRVLTVDDIIGWHLNIYFY